MSLRLVFTIVACGIALIAHNVDGLQDRKAAESSFGTDPISVLPQFANNPEQHKSMHRRQSPDETADSVVCEIDSLTPDKVADISYDTGSLHSNKRSVDVKPAENVAEPGCCG